MDLRQIRADLGVVARSAGFNAWDYAPDDPESLPAAVVGGITELNRLNRIVTQLKIGIAFYVSAADPIDATARLDKLLSVGDPASFIDVLDNVTIEDGPSWRSVRVDSAGPYQRVAMPGGGLALSVTVVVELTA